MEVFSIKNNTTYKNIWNNSTVLFLRGKIRTIILILFLGVFYTYSLHGQHTYLGKVTSITKIHLRHDVYERLSIKTAKGNIILVNRKVFLLGKANQAQLKKKIHLNHTYRFKTQGSKFQPLSIYPHILSVSSK